MFDTFDLLYYLEFLHNMDSICTLCRLVQTGTAITVSLHDLDVPDLFGSLVQFASSICPGLVLTSQQSLCRSFTVERQDARADRLRVPQILLILEELTMASIRSYLDKIISAIHLSVYPGVESTEWVISESGIFFSLTVSSRSPWKFPINFLP